MKLNFFGRNQVNKQTQKRYLKFNNKSAKSSGEEKFEELKSGSFPESIISGDLKILKKKGESVKKDEIIAEVETDKTTIEIKSSIEGVIEEYFVNDGDSIG